MSAQTKTSPIYAEPSFERALSALPHVEQRACLVAIAWFERECAADQRTKSSWKVESTKRRIRAVRASKETIALFAVSNSGQNWIWAGWHESVSAVAERIDAAAISSPGQIDVDLMLANIEGAERVGVAAEAPDPVDVDAWSNSVEETALVVSDTRSLCSRIKTRLGERLSAFSELSALADKMRAENARLATELDAKAAVVKVVEVKAAEPVAGGDLESRLSLALARYNETRAENDRLKTEVRVLTKRMNTATAELSTQRSSGPKLAAVTERMEGLELELQALKAANKKEAVAAVSEEIIQSIKDQCSKVLDDNANRLSATELPMDEARAEDFRRLAMKIRAMKVKVK